MAEQLFSRLTEENILKKTFDREMQMLNAKAEAILDRLASLSTGSTMYCDEEFAIVFGITKHEAAALYNEGTLAQKQDISARFIGNALGYPHNLSAQRLCDVLQVTEAELVDLKERLRRSN